MKGGGDLESYEPKPIFHGFRYVQVDNWPPGWFNHHSSTVGVPDALGAPCHDSRFPPGAYLYIYGINALGCVTENRGIISDNPILHIYLWVQELWLFLQIFIDILE